MKQIIINLLILCLITLTQTEVFAAKISCTTQIKKGTKELNEQKYTRAIASFSKVMKLVPDNIESRTGLAKAYIARADKYIEKEQEWGKAANDYRSALFYLLYFEPRITSNEIDKLISETENKLNTCYKKLHSKKNAYSRYIIAELLRIAQNYSAAGYEYNQAAKDKDLTEKCNKELEEIIKKIK